jgi:hypothetical protein
MTEKKPIKNRQQTLNGNYRWIANLIPEKKRSKPGTSCLLRCVHQSTEHSLHEPGTLNIKPLNGYLLTAGH